VGYIPADPSHIAEGYAAGNPGTDTSGLAFAGELYIYAGFGDPTVAYYHVNAGQWTGNPSRGGTAPSSASPISASLNNYVFISHGATLTFSGPIQMGPFNQGGMSNLYATQGARQNLAALGATSQTSPNFRWRVVTGAPWAALDSLFSEPLTRLIASDRLQPAVGGNQQARDARRMLCRVPRGRAAGCLVDRPAANCRSDPPRDVVDRSGGVLQGSGPGWLDIRLAAG